MTTATGHSSDPDDQPPDAAPPRQPRDRRRERRPGDDRRHSETAAITRGRLRGAWDVLFTGIRFIARRVKNAYAVFGIFFLSGAAVAVIFTWAFAEFAERVSKGHTQRFDDAIMAWVGAHQYPVLQDIMLEITVLGTGLVVGMIVLVSGMFLWLNHHRHSAVLLIAATVGGLILDDLLKIGFHRPRPRAFEWGTHAASSSFPSGHAMSAVIVYGTVTYLAARLQRRTASRVLTFVSAFTLILLISISRVYLGVHYPSDILAGLLVGLAWAGFCMAILEAAQLYARFNAPQLLADERPAPSHERRPPS